MFIVVPNIHNQMLDGMYKPFYTILHVEYLAWSHAHLILKVTSYLRFVWR